MNDVKRMTQVASPPAIGAAEAADAASGAKRVGGEVVDKVRRSARKTMDDVAMTPFLRKISLFSSGGSFLDGYVLSLIGVALTQITPMFDLSPTESAAIGASVMLGIFFGTIFSVLRSDGVVEGRQP